MPRINQEEYEILKRLIEPLKEFKQYIARDEDGMLYAHRVKPRRYTNGCWVDGYLKIEVQIDLFQFIQWEDEEPHSIVELIEEYEDEEYGSFYMRLSREFDEFLKESEETEVKKDKQRLLDTFRSRQAFNNNFSKGYVLEKVKQLDEPDIEGLEEAIEELYEYNNELIRDNNQLRTELDNQETLSQKWIGFYSTTPESIIEFAKDDDRFVPVEELEKILVPETDERTQLETAYRDILSRGEFWFDDKKYVVVEKPTIPQFVADFLDGKEEYALYELFDNDLIYDSHDKLARWLYDNDEYTNRKREFGLVLAHIYDYEVETEQKYYVMNNDNRMMLVRMMDGKTITEADPFKLEDMYEGEKKSHQLTEQEIKGYDERYWAFAVKVEELEE